MGFEDWFNKFVKIGFIRNLRYEPHIVDTVRYVKPESFENILVFYKEVNYLKSILFEHIDKKHIYDCNVENINSCSHSILFDCFIVFLCKNSLNENDIANIIDKTAKEAARIFVVDYLVGSKLFNLALRLSDKVSYSDIKHQSSVLFEKKYHLIDTYEVKKHNIIIKQFAL